MCKGALNVPRTVCDATLVIRSLVERPVSALKPTLTTWVPGSGSVVSVRLKLPVPAVLALPAKSVLTTLTLTDPVPRVVKSASLRTTACVAPVAVMVFVTTPPPAPVKVTTVLLPLSAVTVTTPVLAVASSAVAPSATPVPSTTTGVVGGVLSNTNPWL